MNGEIKFKKMLQNNGMRIFHIPKLIVSCRGKNNALAVCFAANVSIDLVMVIIGIIPKNYSYGLIKASGQFD